MRVSDDARLRVSDDARTQANGGVVYDWRQSGFAAKRGP